MSAPATPVRAREPSPQPGNPDPALAPAGPPNSSNRVIAPTLRFGVTAIRATHQPPSTALGRGGGGASGFNNPGGTAPTTNNNAGETPQQTQNLFQMRDRLFLALFFRVSLIYARAFPKTLRRFIEFCLLMQSIMLLFILGYIHVVYTRTPITCLSEYKDSWPKNGILRVEITSDALTDYDLTKSYAKEERLRQRAAASQFGQYTDDLLSIMLTADTLLLDRVVSTAGGIIATVTGESEQSSTTGEQTVSPTSSVETDPPPDPNGAGASSSISPSASVLGSEERESRTANANNDNHNQDTGESASSADGDGDGSVESKSNEDGDEDDVDVEANQNKSIEIEEELVAAAEGEERASSDLETISPSIPITASGSGEGSVTTANQLNEGIEQFDVTDPDSPYFNKTLEEIEVLKMQQKLLEEDKVLNSSVTDFEMFANSVWLQEQAYIVEYALEYGFLRLSPETRQKLGIPVKLVTLDPSKEPCFGDHFSLFLLENFLGYDDILMSSIKNLAESEENKGYLRNVVTGEQFRFVPMWMARSSYIPALLIMLVFTVSISMLLRYSHHQIFVFIVDLLNNIEGAGSIHIPAAPLFTVILALVGMEAIMSEFFNDTTTAFYVILIVWIADQYDSVCSHTNITKVYWVRFFYLYHFAFYAYHYRFNGQYGGLALLVSWSFIQHSMVYFYHHYELPAILRQAHNPGHLQENMTRPPATPAGSNNQQLNADAAELPSQPQQDSSNSNSVNNSSPGSADNLNSSNNTTRDSIQSSASYNSETQGQVTLAQGARLSASATDSGVSDSSLSPSAPTSFNRTTTTNSSDILVRNSGENTNVRNSNSNSNNSDGNSGGCENVITVAPTSNSTSAQFNSSARSSEGNLEETSQTSSDSQPSNVIYNHIPSASGSGSGEDSSLGVDNQNQPQSQPGDADGLRHRLPRDRESSGNRVGDSPSDSSRRTQSLETES